MDRADQQLLASRVTPTENYPASAEFTGKLMELNQHFLERASAELLEAWHVVTKLNTEPLAVDRIKTCQDWLQAFSRRRIEDATYAAYVTRALSVVGVKVSVGFNTKNDPQTSRTA